MPEDTAAALLIVAGVFALVWSVTGSVRVATGIAGLVAVAVSVLLLIDVEE